MPILNEKSEKTSSFAEKLEGTTKLTFNNTKMKLERTRPKKKKKIRFTIFRYEFELKNFKPKYIFWQRQVALNHTSKFYRFFLAKKHIIKSIFS